MVRGMAGEGRGLGGQSRLAPVTSRRGQSCVIGERFDKLWHWERRVLRRRGRAGARTPAAAAAAVVETRASCRPAQSCRAAAAAADAAVGKDLRQLYAVAELLCGETIASKGAPHGGAVEGVAEAVGR